MLKQTLQLFAKFASAGILIACVIVLSGCGTMRRLNYKPEHTYMGVSAKNEGVSPAFPNSFTVYPFKNTTWDEKAAIRAQEAIHQKLSLIGPCTPIRKTAAIASAPYSPEDALRVAREQKTEAVVIGEAEVQDHIFLVVAAYTYVQMKISIYDTNTGKRIWNGGSWSISGSFCGFSFPFILMPVEPVLEQIFWSRITSDLYHRVAMDIVHKMRPDAISP